jgi:localization factor PodJL
MNENTAVNYEPEEPRTARVTDGAQARRAAIAAARRVITRDGAGRMTLDSVGHEAGLPMGALASHFDNEQELLMAVAAEDLAALAKSMRSSGQSAEPAPGAPGEMIQRVEVLESAFSSMIDRHQKSLHERNDIALWVEQSVKALQQQVSGSEHLPARLRPEAKAAPQPVTAPDPPLPAKVARLLVEPPPVAAVPPPAPVPVTPPVAAVPPSAPAPVAPPPAETQLDELPPLLAAAPTQVTSTSEEAVLMDNYLLDARRAAIATQAGGEQQAHDAKRRSKRTRVVAVAFLGPIAILATAAMVLNRNVVTAEPATTSVPAQVAEIVAPAPAAEAPQALAPEVTVAAPADPAPAQVASAEPLDKLTALATSGDVKAERDLGLKYLAGDGVQANESEAARWLMRAAYRGEPTAEYWLGTLYARGHGVPADAFQANHWYEAAAQKGNRRAMHSFAVAYFQGWGVEKNYSEAARWFRSAADLGFVDSQFNLAVLYERGAGIPQSLTEAYKWYAIAAQGGDKESDSRVAVLATQLAPADLALAQQAAASFKPAPLDQSANLATDASSTGG